MATYTYQVQRSPDGTAWTNITGATGSFSGTSPFTHDIPYLIQNADANDYLRCKVTDSFGNISYSGLVGPVGVVTPPVTPTPSPTFSDEFAGVAGSAPDPTKWYVMNGSHINGITSIASNVFLDGSGHLVVRTSRKSGGGYSAGFCGTFNYVGWPPSSIKESFPLPFRVDARMLMPPTPGAWAALWAMNVDRSTSQSIYELDIAEERLTAPTTAGCHQHTWLSGVDHAPADGSKAVSDMTTNWHIYSSEVYQNHVTNYVDGVAITSFYGVSGVFGLLINNGIGPVGSWGANGGQPAASDPGPWDMLIDYVHVTAL